jgi:hypothetical protein
MRFGSMPKEKHLQMKAPRFHVVVEISQVGIVIHRLVERIPAQAGSHEPGQGRLARTDVPSDNYKVPGHPSTPVSLCVQTRWKAIQQT